MPRKPPQDVPLLRGVILVRGELQDQRLVLAEAPGSGDGPRAAQVSRRRGYMRIYVKREDDALVFAGVKGGPMRRAGSTR